jgi:hypothetical protein
LPTQHPTVLCASAQLVGTLLSVPGRLPSSDSVPPSSPASSPSGATSLAPSDDEGLPDEPLLPDEEPPPLSSVDPEDPPRAPEEEPPPDEAFEPDVLTSSPGGLVDVSIPQAAIVASSAVDNVIACQRRRTARESHRLMPRATSSQGSPE